MITRRFRNQNLALQAFILLLPAVKCHMELSWPYPLRSKYNPMNSYTDIDYSMTSPLNADGSNYPCKGYQNDRPVQPVVTYATGSTYNMSLAGSATHGGGSCQLSLSYDNGASFRVISSMIGDCPLATTYDFTIPSDAPTGQALLAWTWQNLIGNREYYMNCAEVNIISGHQKRRHRHHTFKSFNHLPNIFRANLQGINDCVTVENVPIVYPDPGPNVVYGDGLSSTSTPAPGDCDAVTPYGQTYRNLAQDSSEMSPSLEQPNDSSPSTFSSNRRVSSLPSLESYSTTTVTIDCQTTLTLTTMPSYYVTAAPSPACTGTSASCPCAADYQCLEISPCTWGCEAMPMTTAKMTNPEHSAHSASRSTRILTSTYKVVPVKSTTPAQPPAGTSGSHPPYAGNDVQRFLPCVPGTFICLDRTTWDTCDYNANGQWIYEYPRTVAAGMECVTFLSPNSDGASQYGQQGLTPKGYHRNDRIVRARPDGDCSQNGAIKCKQNGQRFEVCDQGGWVDMGPVAGGTRCEDGKIV